MGFIKAPRDKKAVKPATTTPATAPAPTPAAGRLARTKTSETSPVTTAAPEPINPNAWWVSDVTFIIEGRQVQAHKVVLASRSDHFNFLFSSQPAAQYVITEVSHDAFGLFIRWAYAGSRDVPASGALDLLKCAVAFNVPDLREVCETALTVLAAPAPVTVAAALPALDADVAFNTWSDDPILARSSAGATPAPSSPIDLSMAHDFHSMLSDSMAMDIQV